VQIAQDMGRGMFGTAWDKEKAASVGGLVAEMKRGYLKIKYQKPAQTAVEMIQVQPRVVMRFMRRTMPAFGSGHIDQRHTTT
jgi:hypothetical protein